MIQTYGTQANRGFLGRAALPLAGAIIALCLAGKAYAAPDEDQPQGRLGYKWVEPPKARPVTDTDRLGMDIAKYGGAGLIGVWLLRKMFAKE